MNKQTTATKVTKKTTDTKKGENNMNKQTTATNEVAEVKASAIVAQEGLKALGNALNTLGYEALATNDYSFTVEKEIDGKPASVTVQASEDEKGAIDEMYVLLNIAKYSKPRQCALLAYWESKGTHKEKGVTFKAYAKSVVCGTLDEGTIQKYTNIGKCFFKALESTESPVEWVDERLANMNDKHGVSVTNLDAILSTFKAYADNAEIEGCDDYRDYVKSFIDKFCIDSPDKKADLHLEGTLNNLRDEVRKLNGKDNAGKKGKKGNKGNEKPQDNEKTLNPFDGLVNALTRYKDSEKPNKDILGKVTELLEMMSKMPEVEEK